MELVSRNRASEVLSELVGALDHLEKVPTISDIYINPNFDSALEARFIESLRRLGGTNGLPPVKLVQDIVNGKSGFLLELGGQRYWIELQRDIGPMDGVAVQSRPDFVIWPAQSTSSRRAIAVFCDGWAYHKDSLRADARKRSALVASGRYWVWSVTHEDVKAALAGDFLTDLDSPLTTLNRHDGQVAPPSLPRAEHKAFSRNAVAQLLGWLVRDVLPDEDPMVLQLRRNAAWLTFLMVPTPKSDDARKVQDEWTAMLARLPVWMHDLPARHVAAVSRPGIQPRVMLAWPASLARGNLAEHLTPGLLTLDDETISDESALHLTWRRWLALFNTVQTLPGLVMTTQSAIAGGDLVELEPAAHKAPAASEQGAAQAAAWKDAIDSALAVVQDGLRQLAAAGAIPPTVGYEHVDEHGEIVAEAELAWPAQQVAVMLAHQLEFAPFWAEAGWTAIDAASDWVGAVLAQLSNPAN
jgi:DEAD/DEAH box helicase domain-containing protein